MSGRVWVTGLGLVTPLGSGVEATWTRLIRGDRALGPVTLFAAGGQRASCVGEASAEVEPGAGWSRTSAMALAAAGEALAMAGLAPGASATGLVVGGTTGGMFETEQLLAALHGDRERSDGLHEMLAHPLTATADRLEERLGPFARARTLSSACSSGANALVVAAGWLLAREVDAVVAGGSDGLCRLTLSGFNAIAALDPQPCRPFDRGRRGTNLGEGAGFVVLEREETARARGASPIAELAGWAIGSEAHHVTNPAPDGAVVASLIERALARAGVAPSGVDYVNAHGTGTVANDRMEAAALARALGGELPRVPVSSSKGQIGHTLGAAGAIEAVLTALAIARRVLPPTAGLDEPDPALPLAHVRGAGREAPRVRAAISNSFGFGGMDTVLVLAEPRGDRPAPAPAAPPSVVVAGAAAFGPGGLRAASGAGGCAALFDGPPASGPSADPEALLDVDRARRLDPAAQLGAVAVGRALAEAGAEPAGTGLVLGGTFGSIDGSAAFMHRVLERGPRSASPAEFPNLVPSACVGLVSIYCGLRGPAFATTDLAASGEGAVVQAVQLIAAGEATLVAAGAAEPEGHIAARVLPAILEDAGAKASGPRRGVAAAVVLEVEERARARGARVLARVERAIEWRGDGASAASTLRAPRGRAEVVWARESGPAARWLERTSWAAAARRACAPAIGESDALGAVAVAAAAARIGAGVTDEALVVGVARSHGYAILLAAS